MGGAMVIIIFNAYKGLKRRAGESCNVTTNQDAFVIWVKFLRQRKQEHTPLDVDLEYA